MKKVGYVVAVAMLAGGCTTAYWQDPPLAWAAVRLLR